MLDTFRPVQNLIQSDRVKIDGRIFRLHYFFTVMILLTFCILITTKQYVGDPILCSHSINIPDSIVNTYCWIHATYTLSNASKFDVYPGIGPRDEVKESDLKYHKYYQWVCFVLFIQAIMFYIPRWLWIQAEGGIIESLSKETSDVISEEKTRKTKNGQLVDYLINNMGYHDCYMLKYYTCELLAFLNVIGQMFLLDRFLNGEFFKYGLEVLEYAVGSGDSMVDPMLRIFPRISKCVFYNFGPSGNIQKLDVLCMLPINIVNEKIFLFLWFWFIILGFLTALLIVYRSIIVSSVKVRFYVLAMRFCPIRRSYLETLVERLSLGDWFFVYMLGQNIDGFRFNEIIVEYVKGINSRNKKSKS